MSAILPAAASIGCSGPSLAGMPGAKMSCASGTKRPFRRQDGFTLIEVLVSLAILSISLGVLLSVFLQGLDRSRESRDESSARALAQSLLAQAKTVDNPSFGASAGKSNNFLWRLQVIPYGSAQDKTAWQEGAGQIVATVSWRGSGGMRSISLSTLRLFPKPGADSD
jgi:general secretion pathway protein I